MGRRKTTCKPAPKRKAVEALPTCFDCPFCEHAGACDVKIDKKRNTGLVTCRVCSEDFQTRTNYLTEAIDVYNEWIDECEAANKK